MQLVSVPSFFLDCIGLAGLSGNSSANPVGYQDVGAAAAAAANAVMSNAIWWNAVMQPMTISYIVAVPETQALQKLVQHINEQHLEV